MATIRIQSSHSWILQKLQEQYQEMSGMEVLYIWATYLTEGIWMSLCWKSLQTSTQLLPSCNTQARTTNAQSQLAVSRSISLTPESQPLLAAQLLAHSRLCSRTTFDASSFDCAICLETAKAEHAPVSPAVDTSFAPTASPAISRVWSTTHASSGEAVSGPGMCHSVE